FVKLAPWWGGMATRGRGIQSRGAAASAHTSRAAGPTGEAAGSEASSAVAPPVPDRSDRAGKDERSGGGAGGGVRWEEGVPLGRPVQHERVRRLRAAGESPRAYPDRHRRAVDGCGALQPARAGRGVLRLERPEARGVL